MGDELADSGEAARSEHVVLFFLEHSHQCSHFVGQVVEEVKDLLRHSDPCAIEKRLRVHSIELSDRPNG